MKYKRLIIISLSVIGCFSAIIMIGSSTLVKERISKTIVSLLSDQFHGNVTIKKLNTNYVSWITLSDVTLQDSTNSVRFKSLTVKYTLWQLLRGKIVLSDVALDSLIIALERKEQAPWQPPITKKSDTKNKSANGFTIFIHNFTLQNGQISFSDATIPLDVVVEDINFDFSKDETNHAYHGAVDVASISVNDFHEIDKLTGKFRYDSGKLTIEKIIMFVEEQPLQISGAMDVSKEPSLNFQLTGAYKLNSLKETLVASGRDDIPEMKGILRFASEVSGKLSDVSIKNRIESDSIAINNTWIRSLFIEFNYQQRRFIIPDIRISICHGTLNGQGYVSINPDNNENVLQLEIRDLNIHELLRSLYGQASELRGVMNGSFFVKSHGFNLESLAANAELKFSDVSFQKRPIRNLACNIAVENNVFNIKYMEETDFIQATGRVTNQKNIDADVAVSMKSIAPVLSYFNIHDIDGALTAQGKVSGSVSDPLINAAFELRRANYSAITMDDMSGEVELKNKKLYFQNVTFKGKIPELATLPQLKNTSGISGQVYYNGRVHGTLSNPELTAHLYSINGKADIFKYDSLIVDCSIKNRQVNIERALCYHDSFEIRLKGDADVKDDYSYSASLLLRSVKADTQNIEKTYSEQGQFYIDGRITKNHRTHTTIRGEAIALSFFPKYLTFTNIPIGGTANFHVTMEGKFDAPIIDVECDVDSLRLPPLQFDSITLKSSYRNRMVTILDNRIHFGTSECALTGEFPIALFLTPADVPKIDNDVEIKLTGENLSLDFLSVVQRDYQFENLFFDIDLEVNGPAAKPKIAGNVIFSFNQLINSAIPVKITNGQVELKASGNLDEPLLNLSWDSDAVNLESFNANDFRGELEYENEELYLKQASVSIKNRLSYFHGAYPIKFSLLPFSFKKIERPLFIKSYADSLNLAFLAPLIEPIDKITGSLNYNLEIAGTVKNPQIKGSARINNGTIKFVHVQQAIENITADVDFNEQQTTLNFLSGTVGDGTISAVGTADYDHSGTINKLQVQSKLYDVDIESKDLFFARIKSGELSLTDHDNQYELSGTVDFRELRYVQDIKPILLVQSLQNVNRPQKESNRFAKKVKNNIKILVKDNLWIYNNIAKIRMNADLNVLGTLDKLVVAGSVESSDGYFFYLDRKFNIRHGELIFADPVKINPTIDLEASSNIRSYQNINEIQYIITIQITGTAENSKLKLSADPVLSQPDIIAVLTVGKTRNELLLNGTDSNKESFKDILIERAKSITNQTITSMAEKQVGTLLNLDNIIIEGNLLSLQDNKGPKVTASKSLTKELDLTYSTVVGYSNDQLIKLGYKISDKITVEGETDQQGRSGIDLKLKYKFK